MLREDAFPEALCYLRSMMRVPLILLMIAHQVNIDLIVWQLTQFDARLLTRLNWRVDYVALCGQGGTQAPLKLSEKSACILSLLFDLGQSRLLGLRYICLNWRRWWLLRSL